VVLCTFDGPTKADDVRYVPIVDALLPTLRAWRLRHPGRLVSTNRDGGMLAPSGRIYQEVLHRVLDAAGFPRIGGVGQCERGGEAGHGARPQTELALVHPARLP
jgi:hypothetical protein